MPALGVQGGTQPQVEASLGCAVGLCISLPQAERFLQRRPLRERGRWTAPLRRRD